MTGPVARDDEGAVAVTVALVLFVVVLMTGFVLDLGLARVDRQANQTAADVAATAAVDALGELVYFIGSADAYQYACQTAVDYFLANTPDAQPVTTNECSNFADSNFDCETASTTVSARIVAEPYELRIASPVFDTDPLMGSQTSNPEFDGFDPCARIGIVVSRERDHLFATVAGFGSSHPTSDAVARLTEDGTNPEYATLVVLDPEGCEVIKGDGQNIRLLVQNIIADPDNKGLREFPGVVTLDSDASDCGNEKFLLSPNGSDGRICAGVQNTTDVMVNDAMCISTPRTLLSEAVASAVADGRPGGDVAAGRVAPVPLQRGRVTRQPIEHRYNCRSSGYAGWADTQGSRHLPDVAAADPLIPACDAGPSGHIDDLIAAYGGKGPDDFTDPVWTTIDDDNCDTNAGSPVDVDLDGDPHRYTGTHFYVSCSPFNIRGGATVEFVQPQVIVFGGSVQINGQLRVNTIAESDDDDNPTVGLDNIVFVQEGGDIKHGGSSGDVDFYRTFVYLEDGVIDLQSSIDWEAPRDSAYQVNRIGEYVADDQCAYTDAPVAACFENLALWSNSPDRHDLAAAAGIDLDGIFFTPNAGRGNNTDFRLHGGTTAFDLEHAQFFTYRLGLSGRSRITMTPDPSRFVATPIIGGGLIR